MPTAPVRSDLHQGRLTLTIARPERRNALNAEVIAQLHAGLTRAAADSSVRVVVLTGEGAQAFCAGADLGTNSFAFDHSQPTAGYANLLRAAHALHVPLLARVNGACMAGGMGLLAMCDLAVAAEHASFGLPEAKIGLFPMQVLAVLQGVLAQRDLTRLCLTGDPIDAATAREMRLVNEVAADLDAAVDGLVDRLTKNSPAALRRGLYAMKTMRGMAFEHAIAFGEGQIGLMAMTQDAREGLASFQDKRAPQWTGK